MANTLFIIVILNLFIGSFGSENHIFLNVKQNGTTSMSTTNVDIHFNSMENILIECNVDSNLNKNGHGSSLSLIKDGVTIKSSSDYMITYSEILSPSFDDKELLCQAVSSLKPGTTWRISIHFHMNKTGKELIKQNSFKILLICIGGFIGGSLVLLLCYAGIRRIRKKKTNEESGPDGFPLGSKEVTYAEIDTSMKAKNLVQKTDNPEYAEIGFINQSCDIQENKISNESHIENDRKENATDKQDETKMYVNVDRHGSSTDC